MIPHAMSSDTKRRRARQKTTGRIAVVERLLVDSSRSDSTSLGIQDPYGRCENRGEGNPSNKRLRGKVCSRCRRDASRVSHCSRWPNPTGRLGRMPAGAESCEYGLLGTGYPGRRVRSDLTRQRSWNGVARLHCQAIPDEFREGLHPLPESRWASLRGA
jgi:hypothetical protein